MRIAEFVTPVVRQHRYRERERSKRRRPNEVFAKSSMGTLHSGRLP